VEIRTKKKTAAPDDLLSIRLAIENLIVFAENIFFPILAFRKRKYSIMRL
jgi:hypothetical protein